MHLWRNTAFLVAFSLSCLDCARRETSAFLDNAGAGGDTNVAPNGQSDASSQQQRDLSDVSFTYEGPTEDASLTADAACAAAPVAAEPVALDLYLMLDRSASMTAPLEVVPDCKVGDVTQARWCYAINALAGFFGAPTSNGMGVALQYFPNGNCGWISDNEQNCCAYGNCCTGAMDAVPAVALGRLPGALPELIASLNSQSPLGTTTPIEAALRGLISYTDSARSVDRSMVGILVTDGGPNGCELDTEALAKLISDHRMNTGTKTFIIGTDGANFQTLEQLAVAGGATPHAIYCSTGLPSCSFFNVGAGAPEAFIDALQQIRRSVVGCRFTLPTTDAGILDPSTLVVDVVSPANADRETLVRRASLTDCGDGWYADSEHPGEFSLCPQSCASVQSQVGTSVELLAGCLGS
jgi:hypothetical protein